MLPIHNPHSKIKHHVAPRLYADLAWLWPHLSPPEDYEAEASQLDALMAERLGDGPKRILELGAGGGHTLVHLSNQGYGASLPSGGHHCVAVDLSPTMLEQCKDLIPGVETHVGDMRTVRLKEKFDVVLIHDAIDYLLSADDIAATMQTVREHLVPGGMAFIAPTYLRETFIDGEVADDGTPGSQGDGAGVPGVQGVPEVTFFTFVHDPDPDDDTFEMILLYLIRDERSRRVEVVEDRHTCGLFGYETWMGLIEDAGFAVEYVEGKADADDADDDENNATAWVLFVGTKE